MKAEERHELRENDLANWLQYGVWAFLKANGSYILLILALCFLGYQLWGNYKARQENARNNAFAEYNNTATAENETTSPDPKLSIKALGLLPDLIEKSPAKEVKTLAAHELGRLYAFVSAHHELLAQKELTRASALSKSYEYYAKLLDLWGDDPLIAAKAHIGIAAVYEDQGEWDKATAEYKLIIDGTLFADSPLADLAKDLLASLDDRRNAPRLGAYVPPKPVAPLNNFQNPGMGGGLSPLPGGGGLINPGTSLMGPTGGGSAFQGLMLGPPSTAPTTSPFGTPLPPFGGGGSFNGISPISPLSPSTGPSPLTPSTQPN